MKFLLLIGLFLLVISVDAVRELGEGKRSGPHDPGQKRGDHNTQSRGDPRLREQRRNGLRAEMKKRDEALANFPRNNQPKARPNKRNTFERGTHRRSEELPHKIYTEERSRSVEENAIERPRKSTDENGVSKRQDYLIYPPYYPPYYTETKCDICCEGKKYVGEFPSSVGCCGSKPYDTNTALCCNNKITKCTSDCSDWDYRDCCGDGTYNTLTQRCCENRAVTKVPLEQCCGDQTFNVKEQVCCGTKIYNRPTYDSWGCCLDKLYDTSKDQCMEEDTCDSITPGELPYQCGRDTIDFHKQICCNDMPVDRVDNYTLCCGTKGYQSNEYICCGTQTYKDEKTGTQECCGDNIICTLIETCCDNTAVTLPKGPDCSGYYCCGKKLYDSYTQICCIDEAYNTTDDYYYYPYYYSPCCGNKIFDQNTQTCCSTTVINGYNVPCCGDRTYDASAQTCCNDTLYTVGDLSPDTCCDCVGSCYPYPIIYY